MLMATFLVPTLALLVVMPVVAWVFGLVFRVLGWTIRTIFAVLGIVLLPLWILLAVVFGGFALAAHVLVPLALIWLVGSMITDY